jgi:hypothetical protein
MTDSRDSLFARAYRCQDCGGDVGFRSRRRTFTERYILPLFLMQPVRCGECFRRDYRFIFIPVRERSTEIPRISPLKAEAPPPKQNVA